MPLVLGVDSSTQATKVEVRDADSGALVASGRAPHPSTTPPRSEQDPADWWRAFEEACSATGVPLDDIAAVSVAAQQHGLVPLDAAGEVIRPAKLWNDTESAPDAGWLLEQLGGPEAWAAACGSVPVAAFTITKLSWLHRSEPDAWARLARVGLPHDWVTWRLTGTWVTDRGDASGTGYWSPADGGYRHDLLAIVDRDRDWIPALPTVLGPAEPAGQWAAGGGALVGPGTGDNMAAALGLGLRPGDVVISIGTSGTVFTRHDEPTHDPTGAVAGFADATGHHLPLVCTLNATKVTDAFARLLGWDRARFDDAATNGASGGLVLVPYLDGERTPDRPDARGVLRGLRSDVTPEQVARAAVEGVVCGLLDGLDALAAAGVATGEGRLIVTGGGARSTMFPSVVASLTGRPVTVAAGAEFVARGAAIQAAAVLRRCSVDEVRWAAEPTREVEPASDLQEVRAAYEAAACGV